MTRLLTKPGRCPRPLRTRFDALSLAETTGEVPLTRLTFECGSCGPHIGALTFHTSQGHCVQNRPRTARHYRETDCAYKSAEAAGVTDAAELQNKCSEAVLTWRQGSNRCVAPRLQT